jgi:hypothetical protein
MTPKRDASQFRCELRKLAEEGLDLASHAFSAHLPLIKGSVYSLRRKCGKSNCVCAQGKLHPVWVLSASMDGKTRLKPIGDKDLDKVKKATDRYRQFRKSRARLVVIHRAMLELIDALDQARQREV